MSSAGRARVGGRPGEPVRVLPENHTRPVVVEDVPGDAAAASRTDPGHGGRFRTPTGRWHRWGTRETSVPHEPVAREDRCRGWQRCSSSRRECLRPRCSRCSCPQRGNPSCSCQPTGPTPPVVVDPVVRNGGAHGLPELAATGAAAPRLTALPVIGVVAGDLVVMEPHVATPLGGRR